MLQGTNEEVKKAIKHLWSLPNIQSALRLATERSVEFILPNCSLYL